MKKEIDRWLTVNRERILELNKELVGIPSENLASRGNEQKVQSLVAGKLEELGFEVDVFTPAEVVGIESHEAFLNEGRSYDNRPNVVGVWKGRGNGKSLMFSGHMDTVPRDRERWSKDPFGGVVEGDFQYGLGIFDMKGGMAAALMAAACLKELGLSPAGDLLLEFVVDEEFGGANGTLACRLRGYRADAVIIPEPTNMAICPAAQAGIYFRISFEGKSGRSFSGEQLINPVVAMAHFMNIVEKYAIWRNDQANVPEMYRWNPERITSIQGVTAGNHEMDLVDRVPQRCHLDLWMQDFPGVTEESLQAEFLGFIEPLIETDPILRSFPLSIERKIRFLPPAESDSNHPIVQTLRETGAAVCGKELECHGAPFACDAFMFAYSDTPFVILGPSGGNAHAADEYIRVSDFLRLVEIYALTMADWCGFNKT
jgi:acetylornithine deacetylase